MPFDHRAILPLRKSKGLTQQAAAKRAGLTQSEWSEIETGKRPDPAISVAEAVAKALGIRVATLIVSHHR